MRTTDTLANLYIALWNETEPQARREKLDDLWTTDGAYADPLTRGAGHEEIDALIAGVHRQFPGFVFQLLNTPDGCGEVMRFAWGLGPGGAEPVVEGTDFCTIRNGRLHDVVGFIDKIPD
ncbi:putative isomerase (plasmid) [Sinorhizobium sojae CCBAU 05684]|uniref:Putative isomerase n=1 Tax=Sinorhizobium sojae CCBAU 05684 TaxID=716928 RepID=A0A249PKC9_9HYPH|nr:nuclear transport factor 2 family protein [Sinorhizobium sojae]ASY66361.1 putative isomerase [Sinorhizobium sojae CCBAU 05684]